MRTYIDIGCNRGVYALAWLTDPDIMVYAFEPNPVLYASLKEKETDRFKVFDNAIGLSEGIEKFHIGENDAISSLKPLVLEKDGLRYTHVVQVDVIRLDTFCSRHGIENIDHIKVDTQGSDLDVIKSLGAYIHKVKTILCEAFFDGSDSIYENECKESEVTNYLTEFGFELTNRAVDGNYADLMYARK